MTEQQLAALRVETARVFVRSMRLHGLDAAVESDEIMAGMKKFIDHQMRVAVRPPTPAQKETPSRETRG